MIETKTALPEGYKPGLEGVIAGVSNISEVNSEKDTLCYRGYAAHECAEKGTYEEIAYLMLLGKLPNSSELKDFKDELSASRELPLALLSHIKLFPKSAHPMVILRTAISIAQTLDVDGDKSGHSANLAKAKRLIALTPTIIAATQRFQNNQEIISPDPSLGHAANFLYMISGKKPDEQVAKIFDASQVLYAEHGYNASTFSARVTASTLSDMHSAIVSAVGTLKGPLHGGANEAAIDMLLKIGDVEQVESWLKATLERKEKVMGFGHRVYKKQDSRAPFMKILAKKMSERVGNMKLYEISNKLEELIKKEKNLFPNVDYHCAVAYYLMGLPIVTYTPIFAMARMAGWAAHVIEQHDANRLIRPECIYSGEKDLPFLPIEKRI
ncbi:MAG: citrate/2-methylcitrate synthase [Elusimicrobiota bacterium]